jgi:hypothetical protein
MNVRLNPPQAVRQRFLLPPVHAISTSSAIDVTTHFLYPDTHLHCHYMVHLYSIRMDFFFVESFSHKRAIYYHSLTSRVKSDLKSST